MQSRMVSKPGETRTWIAVLEAGEEVVDRLLALAVQEDIGNASFVALGAFEKATIAYFDWQAKKYRHIPVSEQVEVITLVGDIVPDDQGKPSLHAHTVLGRADASTRGGHLVRGYVRPTLEVTMRELPAHLARHRHPGLGVALVEPLQPRPL
ncbi:MAG TPA: PPC domain-containing DNA-binding protein [Rhizomicrobium sp.]|nr:PPC domain-containing DNA-binding protein [Rhizomicrobium sp.]